LSEKIIFFLEGGGTLHFCSENYLYRHFLKKMSSSLLKSEPDPKWVQINELPPGIFGEELFSHLSLCHGSRTLIQGHLEIFLQLPPEILLTILKQSSIWLLVIQINKAWHISFSSQWFLSASSLSPTPKEINKRLENYTTFFYEDENKIEAHTLKLVDKAYKIVNYRICDKVREDTIRFGSWKDDMAVRLQTMDMFVSYRVLEQRGSCMAVDPLYASRRLINECNSLTEVGEFSFQGAKIFFKIDYLAHNVYQGFCLGITESPLSGCVTRRQDSKRWKELKECAARDLAIIKSRVVELTGAKAEDGKLML